MRINYNRGRVYGSKATYTCTKNGKPPSKGSAVRTCQSNGRWSGTVPNCNNIAEYLIGVLNRGSLKGRKVYGIPIQGRSTVRNTEQACVSHNLNLVTQNTRYKSTRSTLTTKWTGDCNLDTQSAIGGQFCGKCSSKTGNPKCSNLATWVSDRWSGGYACTNPAHGGFCSHGESGMKALCISRAAGQSSSSNNNHAVSKPDGLGSTYTPADPSGRQRSANAKAACEHHFGKGRCSNTGSSITVCCHTITKDNVRRSQFTSITATNTYETTILYLYLSSDPRRLLWRSDVEEERCLPCRNQGSVVLSRTGSKM